MRRYDKFMEDINELLHLIRNIDKSTTSPLSEYANVTKLKYLLLTSGDLTDEQRDRLQIVQARYYKRAKGFL